MKLPTPQPTPHVDLGMQYARDVVAGKITVGKWVRLSCKRHLDDLEKKDSIYYFSALEAEKWCRFIELLPHTKGKWARKGEKIVLEPWQCFKTMVLIGWRKKADGLRRFRKAYVLEPRKNAKSTWAAAIGLAMFCIDNEHGAEVYSGATTEKQAWEVFKPARLMAMKTPALLNAFGVEIMKNNMNRALDGAKFEPMIGNPGDGASPSCAIIDEYHEHDTDRMIDTMETGMGAREQPLMLVITTAGDNLAGPCYAFEQYAKRVLEGVIVDEELFVVMYAVDPDVEWDTEQALRMANPNMGVSVDEDFLFRQQRIAKNDPRKIGIFKTKHLNLWVQARDAYFNVQRWQESSKPGYQLSDFKNQPVIISLDLASKHDLVAKEYIFNLSECECPAAKELIDDGYEYIRFGQYYLPRETVDQPENENYRGWEHEGLLTITDGEAVDYVRIREDILEDVVNFQLEELAFDPHQARMMVSELIEEGIECIEVRPLVLNFSEPMKEVDALIRRRALAHNGDPVYTWMLSCVLAKEDEKGNVYPTKDKNQKQNKIDGPVATIMGMLRWMSRDETSSVYETRGVLTV